MPVNPGRLIHFAHNGPEEQLSLGPTVSVVIPNLNEAENLVFVCNTIPAWANEIVIVDGRSIEEQNLRTDGQFIFETRRIHGNSKLHALRDGLRRLRTFVREMFRGYDVAPI
jgi:glycosyltransferase involved in cell wall biosynthesis